MAFSGVDFTTTAETSNYELYTYSQYAEQQSEEPEWESERDNLWKEGIFGKGATVSIVDDNTTLEARERMGSSGLVTRQGLNFKEIFSAGPGDA